MLRNNSDTPPTVLPLVKVIKYRMEQEVSIKLNRLPVNNTQVKTDYTVMRHEDNPFYYSVRVNDYISKISPDSHQELLDIVKEIDKIKSNVDVLVNASTGKPEYLKNHLEIINEWLIFKNNLLEKNKFVRAKEAKDNIANFVSVFDEQIKSHNKLISGLDAQIFFNTFFDCFFGSK